MTRIANARRAAVCRAASHTAMQAPMRTPRQPLLLHGLVGLVVGVAGWEITGRNEVHHWFWLCGPAFGSALVGTCRNSIQVFLGPAAMVCGVALGALLAMIPDGRLESAAENSWLAEVFFIGLLATGPAICGVLIARLIRRLFER